MLWAGNEVATPPNPKTGRSPIRTRRHRDLGPATHRPHPGERKNSEAFAIMTPTPVLMVVLLLRAACCAHRESRSRRPGFHSEIPSPAENLSRQWRLFSDEC